MSLDMNWVKASIERDIKRALNDRDSYIAMAKLEPDPDQKSELLDKAIDMAQFADRQQRRLDGAGKEASSS